MGGQVRIGEHEIGSGRCFIIAEVGLAHDGSLQAAHAYIDAVSKRGVDAVKFQCHLGDTVSEWRVEPFWGQETRQGYWKRTDFVTSDWVDLANHAAMVGIEFLCSPFSARAVEMLKELVPAWKIPSGKIADAEIREAVRGTGKPVIVSTGLATSEEMKLWPSAVRLQCTTMYPCPPEYVGLGAVRDCAGLSDHSGTIYPGIAAAALGAEILEVHVCFSKEQGGFDAYASLDMGQLGELVRGVRFIEKAMNPVDKDEIAQELHRERALFMGEGGKK